MYRECILHCQRDRKTPLEVQYKHTNTLARTHTHTHALTGFSAVIAAGPFSTSDSLDMAPLDDLIAMVMEAGPDILLLVTTHHYIIELLLFSQMGPFVDINNSIVKVCN